MIEIRGLPPEEITYSAQTGSVIVSAVRSLESATWSCGVLVNVQRIAVLRRGMVPDPPRSAIGIRHQPEPCLDIIGATHESTEFATARSPSIMNEHANVQPLSP